MIKKTYAVDVGSMTASVHFKLAQAKAKAKKLRDQGYKKVKITTQNFKPVKKCK